MTFSIVDHRLLGPGVSQGIVAKDSGRFAQGLPDTLVVHFTAGASFESSVSHLSDPDVRASAHLVVGRDGRVVQLVPFDRIAWHAGESSWKGRTGLNRFSIGVELDNAGRLGRMLDGQFRTWWGGTVPPAEAVEAVHRNESSPSFWQTFAAPQVEVCFEVCSALVRELGLRTILGHEEISPGRKVDPGPAFPLDRLREELLG